VKERPIKINCTSCAHNLLVDDAYDDFEGLFKWYIRGALQKMKTAPENQIRESGGTQVGGNADGNRPEIGPAHFRIA
jgi:hypothetical protein